MPMTRTELAAGLGIDPALVTRYRGRGMPVDAVEAARAWMAANVRAYAGSGRDRGAMGARQGGGGAASRSTASYLQARAERERIEAERARLELAKAAGALVVLADVEAEQARRLVALREQLLQIGPRVAQALAIETDAEKCRDLVDAELAAVLAATSGA